MKNDNWSVTPYQHASNVSRKQNTSSHRLLSLSRVRVSNGNDNGVTAGTMATLQLSMFQCRKRCNLIERGIPMSTTNHVIRYRAVLSSPDS